LIRLTNQTNLNKEELEGRDKGKDEMHTIIFGKAMGR
jgi:hypothetical protein